MLSAPSSNEELDCTLRPSRRRGATALEYLVCISSILVVVIITVQHLGSVVANKFQNNAAATAATNQGEP